MPTYRVTTPEGAVYRIEGPEGASEQQLILAAKRYERQAKIDELTKRRAELNAAPTEPPETTFGGNVKEFFKGVVPGAIGLAETAGTGIAAMLPEETEKAAREKIKEIAGIAKKPFEAAEGYQESVGRRLSEGLGSTIPFFLLGPAGLAGRAAAAGLGVAAGAGEARESAEQKGATPEERRTATLLGAPTGLLDLLAPNIPGFKSIITTALARGGIEGATEAAQKISQNLIAKGVYDPSQPVLAGSGEEGAYGAGVGALASLILDLTVGRKARQARFGERPAETQPPPPPESGVRPPSAQAPQGELFPAELAQAQEEVAKREGPPTSAMRQEEPARERTATEAGQMSLFEGEAGPSELETKQPDLFGMVMPDRKEEAAQEEPEVKAERDERQQELPLTGGATKEEALEEIRKLDEAEKKFEEDLAQTDARIKQSRERETEEKRFEILLPILDSGAPNIPKTFIKELQKQGFTDLKLTDTERDLIKSAYDVRLKINNAKQVIAKKIGAENKAEIDKLKQRLESDFYKRLAVTSEIEPSAPAELEQMESLIPEKKETRTPEQPSFPGMGKPKGAAPVQEPVQEEEVETAFSPVITPDLLDGTGLSKQSGYYKQLVNKDMTVPEQQNQVRDILVDVRSNPNLSASTKQGIERVAMQAFGALAKQGELFGPKGGVIKPASKPKPAPKTEEKKEAPKTEEKKDVPKTEPKSEAPKTEGKKDATDKDVKQGSGDGAPSGESRKTAGDTEKPATPKRGGVASDAQPADETGVRKEPDGGTLKKEAPKTEAKKEEKKEAPKTEAKKEAPKTETKKADPKLGFYGKVATEGAVETSATGEPMVGKGDAIDALAYDVYVASMFTDKGGLIGTAKMTKMLLDLRAGRTPEDLNFGGPTTVSTPESGGKYARSFFESLDEAGLKRFREALYNYFTKVETQVQMGISRFSDRQAYEKALQEQLTRPEGVEAPKGGDRVPARKPIPVAEHGDYKPPRPLGLRVGAMDFADLPSGASHPAPEELKREFVVFYQPVHPAVTKALQGGDLTGALTLLGNAHLGRASTVAKVLAPLMKGVKVELVEDLKNAQGRPLAGSYDYTTNTIRLNVDKYMSPHALLHEATHAAFARVLSNKSHPAYKQLSELYNNVKDSLDTAYGARSLEDFVSEAFSNPEFIAKLAAINPRGEKISAWRRFSNAVLNYLRSAIGLDTKGLDSALDTTDRALLDLLAPNAQAMGVGSLYQASVLGTGAEVFKAIDNRILSLPAINNAWASRFYELIRNKIPGVSNALVLRSLPLNALVEVAVKDIPMAAKLDTLEKQWNGAVDRRRREADATMTRIQRWLKADKNKETVLNDVVTQSTLEQVDPSKPRDHYKDQTSKSGADKQAIWDQLQPQWKNLGEEGQAIYKQMRDTYANYQQDLMNMLFNRIDASGIPVEESRKLKTEIYKRLAVKGKIEPYFPLTRSGGYWLAYNGKGPDGNVERFVEAFPTSVERELAVKQLEQNSDVEKGSIERFAQLAKKSYRDAPPTSFVNNVLRILEANKVNPETTDEVMRAFLATLPETSFAQSFRTRKGTLGFNPNAAAAFYGKSISMSHQLANLEYGAKMYKLRDEMEEFVKTKNNTDTANTLLTELNSHIRTLVSPNISPLSKGLTSGAFYWTLGANVSSVIVNSAHVPMVVMPYLGGNYGYKEANVAIGKANRIFFGSGLERSTLMSGTEKGKDGSTIKMKSGFSFDNYDFNKFDNAVTEHVKKTGKEPTTKERLQIAKDIGLPEDVIDLRELADVATEYGLLSRSMMQDLLESDKGDSTLDKVNKYSSFLFHHGERMNRQVTMLASYMLALDKVRAADGSTTSEQRQAAAEQAIKETELLNGGASAGSAPLLAKNSLGKMMFMYKRYGVSMYYMLFKTTRDMLANEDPQVRAAAKRQIAGVYASSALLAGVQGVPMFGVAAVLYNMFKDDDEDDFETAARKYLGEGMFNGALNYFTGLAVSNRIGLTDLLMQSTGYKDQENIILSFLQLVGGPVYGVGERMVRGAKLIYEGETERGLEQVTPAAIGNAMKSIRFATEGANTLRGDPIVGEIGAWNAFAQFFGFAPAEYTRQLEINASLKNIERSVLENRTKLLRRYYIAVRNGDSQEAADVIKKMNELSSKHPGARITAETIRNSMAQHRKTSAEMYAGVTLNKSLRPELLANANEFDGDDED
jgi:hypothetical protein